MDVVGGRIPGKEEDCWTERKKRWGLAKEEEGVKERGGKEGELGRARGRLERTRRQSDTTA